MAPEKDRSEIIADDGAHVRAGDTERVGPSGSDLAGICADGRDNPFPMADRLDRVTDLDARGYADQAGVDLSDAHRAFPSGGSIVRTRTVPRYCDERCRLDQCQETPLPCRITSV